MKQCAKCGIRYRRPPSKLGNYCSRDCFYKDKYGEFNISAVCIRCGLKFKTNKWRILHDKGKFCSFKCRCKSQEKRISCQCQQCGVLFEKKESQHKRSLNHFCSQDCSESYHVGVRAQRFNGGCGYGPEWKKIAAIIRSRDVVCQKCGKTQKENRRKLDVHHLIPFYWFGYKHRTHAHCESNLVALCRSCHKDVEENEP